MHELEFRSGAIKPVECLKEAWALIKDDYWLLFGISIIGAMIAGLTLYVLFGAMVCGIFGCYLKKIDGGEVKFEDLWKGMRFLVPSIPIVLLFLIPIIAYVAAAFFTLYSPLIALAAMGEDVDPSVIYGTFAAAIAIDIVIAVVMTIIHSLIIFAFPLMVDRGINAIDAVKLSFRAVVRNIGGIGGLILVSFAIVLLGQIALCIGVYFIIPVLTATNLVAYRKVFPKLT